MLRAMLLFFLAVLTSAFYVIRDDYTPESFASRFDFFTEDDPTHGYVNYIDQNTAESVGLYSVDNNQIYMGVDHTNIASGRGRDSVRISSRSTYNHGLFILDLARMPGGQCGTWPAYWLLGPIWPNGGEVDIIEGVNSKKINGVALHTTPGCTISNRGQFSGELLYTNCDINAASQPYNSGCAIDAARSDSYGAGFNAIGGGVYATEWTSDHIAIWFFPRSALPADIVSGEPNPDNWGLPLSDFSGNCDLDAKFRDQQIIFDITFCGDWAGYDWNFDSACNSRASSCNSFVQNNPGDFTDAYWRINSLRVFEENGLSAKPGTGFTTSTNRSTTKPTTTATPSSSSSDASTTQSVVADQTTTSSVITTLTPKTSTIPATSAVDTSTFSSTSSTSTHSISSSLPSMNLETPFKTTSRDVSRTTSTTRTTRTSMNPNLQPSAVNPRSSTTIIASESDQSRKPTLQSRPASSSDLSTTTINLQTTTMLTNSTLSSTTYANVSDLTQFTTPSVRWINSTSSFAVTVTSGFSTSVLASLVTTIPTSKNTKSDIIGNATTILSSLVSVSTSDTTQLVASYIIITLTRTITSCPLTTDTPETNTTTPDMAGQTESSGIDANSNNNSMNNGEHDGWTRWEDGRDELLTS